MAEAEWLGDRDGRAGMGERIWPTAFEIDAKLRARHDERGKELKDQHDKCLRVYAAGEAKKWPKTLPGAKQREEYERLKCAALARLSTAAQALEPSVPATHHATARKALKGPFLRTQGPFFILSFSLSLSLSRV